MGERERIDKFREDLRTKVASIDNDFRSLQSKIDSKAQTAEQDVRTQMDSVKKQMEQARAKLAAAQTDVNKWAEERKAATKEKIAEWKTKRETAKLQNRAESAAHYAAATAVVALAAIDEAVQATLEAWLARKDADSTQSTKAA